MALNMKAKDVMKLVKEGKDIPPVKSSVVVFLAYSHPFNPAPGLEPVCPPVGEYYVCGTSDENGWIITGTADQGSFYIPAVFGNGRLFDNVK